MRGLLSLLTRFPVLSNAGRKCYLPEEHIPRTIGYFPSCLRRSTKLLYGADRTHKERGTGVLHAESEVRAYVCGAMSQSLRSEAFLTSGRLLKVVTVKSTLFCSAASSASHHSRIRRKPRLPKPFPPICHGRHNVVNSIIWVFWHRSRPRDDRQSHASTVRWFEQLLDVAQGMRHSAQLAAVKARRLFSPNWVNPERSTILRY